MSLLEVITERARVQPGAAALRSGTTVVTYSELVGRAGAIATVLKGRGLESGDRALFVADNSYEFVAFALGVWKAGGIVATAYSTSGEAELAYIVRNAAPRLAFVSQASVERVRAAVQTAGLATTLVSIDQPESWELFAGSTQPLPSGTPRADVASGYLCYTSGSTAHPKAVMHSQSGILAAVLTYRNTWHVSEGDTLLVAIPLAWAYGLLTSVMVALTAGACVQLIARYKPDELFRNLDQGGITVLLSVTTHFVKLLDHARSLGRTQFARGLRLCVSGGEPRNEIAFDEWSAATGCRVFDVYAATEAFPTVTSDPTASPSPPRGAAGRVVDGCTFRIVNEQGADVEPGISGEAQWRSPAMMLGYWGDPAATAGALTPDGFYRSGDRVRADANGFVFIEGRYSDLILRGGANISPLEVEAILSEHPSVAACVVCGLPDRETGQIVAAAVILAAGHELNINALQAHCATRLARYKQPTFIAAVTSLPMTATGKTKRRDVSQILESLRLRAGGN
jgi:long-chain acyl-CoA synthetase